jgi:hypothetical protein
VNRVIYSEYDETGRILGVADVDLQAYEKMQPFLKPHVMGHGNPNTQYVLEGVIVDRPIQQTTLTNQTLYNVPDPSIITINDSSYTCNDTTCELDFPYPGTYLVKVVAFPYKDFETVITV